MFALEEMGIVALVDQSIDQRDALPGVVLQIEHERLDLVAGSFRRKTRTPRAAELRLHLLKIDHRGLRG